MIKRNISLFLVLGAFLVGSASGWFVNGWRLESKFAEAQVAAIEEYDRLQQEKIAAHLEREKRESQRRQKLVAELSKSRSIAKELERRLDTLNVAEVVNEDSCIPDGGVVTPDFVSLWNSSASGSGPAGDSTE